VEIFYCSVGAIHRCNSCEGRIPRRLEVAAGCLAKKRVAFFIICVDAGLRTGSKFANSSNQPFGVGTVGTIDDVVFAHECLSERVSEANVG
jgi:hypothetical protein